MRAITTRGLVLGGVVFTLLGVADAAGVAPRLRMRITQRFNHTASHARDAHVVVPAGTPLLDGSGRPETSAAGAALTLPAGTYTVKTHPVLPVAGGEDLLLALNDPTRPLAFIKRSAVTSLAAGSPPLPSAADSFDRMSALEFTRMKRALRAAPVEVHPHRATGTWTKGESFAEFGWAHDQLPAFAEGALNLPGTRRSGEPGFVLKEGDTVWRTGVSRRVHARERGLAAADHTFFLCFVKLADGRYLGTWLLEKDLVAPAPSVNAGGGGGGSDSPAGTAPPSIGTTTPTPGSGTADSSDPTNIHIRYALGLINQSRAERGLPLLALDTTNGPCALRHAQDLSGCVNGDFANFESCAHKDFKSGDTCHCYGECQGYDGPNDDDPAFKAMHDMMMAEGPPPPGEVNHYSIITDPTYKTVAIGEYVDAAGRVWLSEEYK